jgi:hypothetical protein
MKPIDLIHIQLCNLESAEWVAQLEKMRVFRKFVHNYQYTIIVGRSRQPLYEV